MNVLLIFFAIPLAVIILSAIFESFINCPFKVAGLFFSIFIVVAFALGGTAELLVATIVYTIISFITAIIIRLVINRRCNNSRSFENNCASCNSCTGNNFNVADFNNLNTLNTLNNLNRIGIGVDNNLDNQNILTESSNTNNPPCRRFR